MIASIEPFCIRGGAQREKTADLPLSSDAKIPYLQIGRLRDRGIINLQERSDAES